MKYTQNERINQISERTLVIGIDIASETHYARAFDNRGIEYGKVIKFNNDIQGFKEFSKWTEELISKFKKTHTVIGMEPTGHYWFNLAHYLKDNQMVKIVLVNPFHVKRSKEMDDNNPTKNDRKDPKTIAMLVKDGRYMEPYIPEGIYSDIRNASDTRWKLLKQLNSVRNNVQRWLSIFFPEFKTVFGDWEGKAALMALNEFPTPQKVVEKGIDGITSYWKTEINRAIGIKRATHLFEAASMSVGVKTGLRSAVNELKCLLEQYKVLMNQYETTMALIEELVLQIPGVSGILEIKGIGMITVAGFIAEVGDISRFEHPKQIQKLAGLNLKENSSGQHKGKTTISKRGRRRLRSILFQCMIPLLAKNKEFKEIHKYYTTRENNPLKKKQSMILICCKLIRIFFALLKKNVAYSPQKMLSDIVRETAVKAA